MKLRDVAEKLDAEFGSADPETELGRLQPLDKAGPGDLTFLADAKYAEAALASPAAAIICSTDLPGARAALLRVANPRLAFARALDLFHPAVPFPDGVHSTAIVDPSAELADDVTVGAYTVIEAGVRVGRGTRIQASVTIGRDATIGSDCRIHSQVAIREECVLGDRVVLQNGAVIGSDGFGFATDEKGQHHKIRQAGIVVLEDDVEVQALTAIDRATMGETRIRKGTKIDNLVQIGHHCDVGEHSLLCGQSGLAGSTTVGRNVVLAGQVGVAGHLTIGDRVVASAQTGIDRDVEAGKTVSGFYAKDTKIWLRCLAGFYRLPQLIAEVRELRKLVDELQKR